MIKINMVVKRGVNDGQILPMARHFKGSGHIVRFIEFMDVGASNGWRMDDVVPSREIVALLDASLWHRAGRSELRRRGRRTLALSRRLRRSRRHLFGDAAVLPQLLARAPVHRRPALHLPVCHRRATTSASLLRGGYSDEQIARGHRRCVVRPR